ncbi:hypothetical protein [Hymenobacter cheonanensis]|uniref:hypothetical protein n=1 Tax=Hymenobacter sp. CA2-7 TaxID=3063993 RepID=UPI0027136BE1|nr:hypothetical protein [Hymenobacter sp. CA2-7]MDO7884255.1 hypothetical protein [Hymenobacter sp. CA2-7]
MLKKTGYFYLLIGALTVLLALAGKTSGPDTDAGFYLEVLATLLLAFLFYTSPIWVIVLLIITFGKPLKKFFTQAERFHAGDK